ncbi:MAG: ABC transporter substrate-binding protein [Actinomycetota bacterium]
MRRHPNPRSLAAWFDGEGGRDVADHLAACDRCRRRVVELRRVRAAVLGQPIPAPLLAPGALRWRPVAAPIAIALVLVALLAATIPSTVTGPVRAIRDFFDTHTDPGGVAGSATTSTIAPVPTDTAAATTRPGSGLGPDDAVTTNAPAAESVLRLVVVVPAAGPLAAEGADTVAAVRQLVESANLAGGVDGRDVELVVVDAGDPSAVARLTGSVAVGGFGATPPVPWLFPADPYAPGSLAAEVSPFAAGAFLAAELKESGVRGSVASVVAGGPDAALADGVAGEMTVVRVASAAATSCDTEIQAARRALPAALALAVPPELARRCLDAAARIGWRPPGGILLAPSAAYAGLERAAVAAGARTVLGLPWPTGDEPGATRFRAAVPGVRSYRALVAYAAAELAVASARATFPFGLDDLAGGTWRTDLVSLSEGHNVTPRIVAAGQGGWETVKLVSGGRE